ncbi:MAG: DUF5926 family protein [Pseudonocardiales bacterium]
MPAPELPVNEPCKPRQPCPCGSGKRYKACHGAAGGAGDVIVIRPYAGLAAECQLVALREFVPSATAPLPLVSPAEREIVLATVLPTAAAALIRNDGTAFVALQVLTRSGDVSRDLGRAVHWALTAAPGALLPAVDPKSDEQIRLQDLLAPDTPLEVTLHADFSWWIPGEAPPTGAAALSMQRANEAILPTEAIIGDGIDAAYWVDAGEKAHLRWVRPEPEEELLAALARLASRNELDLGDGSRYAGTFRAHGLLVPVWDLDPERHSREWTTPAEAFALRLQTALIPLTQAPLTPPERRALHALHAREVTLR